jgi:hypothetical protein
VPHLRSRPQQDFTNPRAAFTRAVRALTSTAREQLERLVRTLLFTGFMSDGDLRVLLVLWFEGEYPKRR